MSRAPQGRLPDAMDVKNPPLPSRSCSSATETTALEALDARTTKVSCGDSSSPIVWPCTAHCRIPLVEEEHCRTGTHAKENEEEGSDHLCSRMISQSSIYSLARCSYTLGIPLPKWFLFGGKSLAWGESSDAPLCGSGDGVFTQEVSAWTWRLVPAATSLGSPAPGSYT